MVTPGTNEFARGASSPPTQYELPDVIAGHRLLRCVGEGSYGKVFLARNELTGVYRALKVVFRGAFADARPYQREFEAICRFEPISRSHPGFVQILQVGKLDEAFYYIMEIADDAVAGPTFEPDRYKPRTLSLNRGQMLPIERCIEIGSSLADCLGVLHENKLIHRDIKPSNIIFVNGAPKLADIGLVTQIDEANSMVGTAGFMPPEGPIAAQSDIFSLGKVLYEIATGKDRCEFPELPDDITTESTLHLELNQILLRACDPRPEKRYATVRDMRRELELLHAGQSIKRLRQVEKRLRAVRVAFALSFVVAVAGFLVFLRIEARRNEAARERQRQAGSLLAQGTIEMQNGYLSRALPYFLQAAQLDPREMRSHQLRIGSVRSLAPSNTKIWASSIAGEFSEDGRWLLVPKENKIQIHESISGRVIETHDVPFAAEIAKISRGRDRIAAAAGSELVIIQRESKERSVHTFPSAISDFAFAPHEGRIAVALASGTAFFLDPQTGKETSFPGKALVRAINFDREGEKMLTCYGTEEHPGYSHLRDGRTGEIVSREFPSRYPYRGEFSRDGSVVVICGWRTATPYRVANGELAGDIIDSDDAIMHCAFSPDGALLATASYDGTVRLWDTRTFNALRVNHILEHRSRPEDVVFVDNETLVTRCIDGQTYVWKLGTKSPDATRIPAEPKSDPLVIARQDAQLKAEGRRIMGTVKNREIDVSFPTKVQALALSPGGDAFAAGSKDELFEITQGRLFRLESLDRPVDLHHRDGINYITFSHSGDRLVTCSEDFSAILWDAKTGRQIGKAMRHRWQVVWASFSSDDKWVATVGWDDVCMVWDASTGEPLTVPMKINEALDRVSFAPGDNSLIVHGRTNMYRLDLPFATLPLEFSSHESAAPLALSEPPR